MQRYGSGRIAQVKMSLEWYRENSPPYRAAFEDGTIVLPRDTDVLADHRLLKSIDGIGQVPRAERTKGQDGAKRHGDAAIAGMLAYAATRMDVALYEYVSGAIAPGDGDDRIRQDGGDREVRVTGDFRTNPGIW